MKKIIKLPTKTKVIVIFSGKIRLNRYIKILIGPHNVIFEKIRINFFSFFSSIKVEIQHKIAYKATPIIYSS